MESDHLLPPELLAFPSFPPPPPSPSAYYQSRLRYYIPILNWLPTYDPTLLQNDILSGLTVASVIIPQSLSYAQVLVKIPPILGLISTFVPQFIYAILGTSKQLSVGPEALVSILVGSSIREFQRWKDPVPSTLELDNIQPTALLSLMVGLFTLLLGILRLGYLDSVLSRGLLRGFVLAVGGVVMVDMVPGLIKIQVDEEASTVTRVIEVIYRISEAHLLTSLVSLLSIVFLVGMKIAKKKFKCLQVLPEILVLVVTSIGMTWFWRWDLQGLEILGDMTMAIPPGTPTGPLPTIPKIRHLLLPAILISVIGFVESIVVAKTYASKHNYGVSPNRELVAMGVGNVVGSLCGGFPAFGSLGRSAINDGTGSRSQLSGLITALTVLFTSLFLLPLFHFLPKPVCASIIVMAAFSLIEMEEVYFLIQVRAWSDLALLGVTFLSTVIVGIESGTLLSVGISLLMVVKHTTTTRLVLLGESVVDGRVKYKQLDDRVRRVKGVMLIRFEEGMFFGNVGQLRERLKRIEKYGELGVHPGEEAREMWDDQTVSGIGDGKVKGVVFDMKSVSLLDASAAQTMLEIVRDYQDRNVAVCFVKLRTNCKELFMRSGLVELVGNENFHGKISDAVNHINSQISKRAELTPDSGTTPGTSGGTNSDTRITSSNASGLPFRRNNGDDDFGFYPHSSPTH